MRSAISHIWLYINPRRNTKVVEGTIYNHTPQIKIKYMPLVTFTQIARQVPISCLKCIVIEKYSRKLSTPVEVVPQKFSISSFQRISC